VVTLSVDDPMSPMRPALGLVLAFALLTGCAGLEQAAPCPQKKGVLA
jgi:hypothetical protein